MPIDFSAALSLLCNAQDRSENDTKEARAVIQSSLLPESANYNDRLAEVTSFITQLETAKDFSALERTLRVLVEIGVAQTEITTTIDRWRDRGELTLRSIADRIAVQIRRVSHNEHVEPAEVLQQSEDPAVPSTEETQIIKSLCGFCMGRTASNRFAFFRIYPQPFLNGKSRNIAVISKDDCHSGVEKVLTDMHFELCHSFKEAYVVFEKDQLFNFVLMDFSLPRGEKISLEEYQARELVVDKLLLASNTAEYYKLSLSKIDNYLPAEYDGQYYYYQAVKTEKSEYIIAQLKGHLFKPVFQDASLEENHKILISLCTPPDIHTIRYEPIKTGFSGSQTYIITPIDGNNQAGKQSVVKIGDHFKLKAEESNYRTIIEPHIQRPLKASLFLFEGMPLGALKYEFASGIVETGSLTLKQIYQMTDTDFEAKFKPHGMSKIKFLCKRIEFLFSEVLLHFNRSGGTPKRKLGKEFLGYVKDEKIIENLQLMVPGKLRDQTLELYGASFPNPKIFWENTFKDCFKDCIIKPVHGDLHTANIMIDDHGLIFLIDYGKTCPDGNLFSDYAMLEVSIKLDLISRNTPYSVILAFEKYLYSVPDLNADLDFPTDYISVNDACNLINVIRKQAFKLAQNMQQSTVIAKPFEHYLYALFPLSYAQLSFKDMNQQYALISSGLAAAALGDSLSI